MPIPGTRRIERIDENAAAAHIRLSDAQRTQMAAMLAAHLGAGNRTQKWAECLWITTRRPIG